MVKIIADPGSTHMGNYDYAMELVKTAKDCGADAIKFQLFKGLSPNIELPYEWMDDLVDYGNKIGIEVFGSVWDIDGLNLLSSLKCKSVKFSYSMNKSLLVSEATRFNFENIYVSHDLMTYDTLHKFKGLKRYKRLYCIPEYPVKYIIDYESIFTQYGFHGFSSHCMGVHQEVRSVSFGAKIIEKHIRFDDSYYPRYDIVPPDCNFALDPDRFKYMVDLVREIEIVL